MPIKIVSWNIWINNHFSEVKEFLKNSNADIIGLQEVRKDDPSRETVTYLKSLGYQSVFAPITEIWGGIVWEYGPAIFSKHKIVSSKKYFLSEKNNRVAIRADIKINNKILHVFNTHLVHTHQRDSFVQLQQVKELLKQIPLHTSVLLGDFNATPDCKTIQKVKSLLLDADLNNQPTWSMYPEGCSICNPQKVDVRLDYIFTTKDIKTLFYHVENSKGSDHLPIAAGIEL